ncbi:MAG: DMT family transporter [Alphaproteobacteria bacterium]
MFVVLCCMLLAVTTLIARTLGPQIAGDEALHPVQIAWARFFFGGMVVIPVALSRGHDFASPRLHVHFGRVVCGLGGVAAMFAAAGLMPLAEATAISFLSPLFSMVFAVIFLRELVGPWRWGAAAIAFVGAMVLTRPGSDAFQPAALIALTAAMFLGAELIFIKILSGREPHLKILAINNAMAALLASIAVPFFWAWPSPDQWALLVLLGVVMVAAQTLFLKGITIADASVAAPFFYTTLIFAAVYGWIVFGEVPTGVALAGSGLIVLGALVMTWRENLARLRAEKH